MQNDNPKIKSKDSAKSDAVKSSINESDKDNGAKKDEIVLLKRRIEELENQSKRLLADYKNLEKRAEAERRDWVLKANKQLLLQILPVLDTLIFAEKQSKGHDQTLSLSIKQFLDILKLEGVEKIETQGANFDSNLMECIEAVKGEEGKVVQESRPGYTLYGETLRPAHVKVGSVKQNQEKGN
mgnify:CR=1 FL=1